MANIHLCHTALYVFVSLCIPPCVRAFLCVHYHLHWVCEHHTVEANEVLMVQGVHGVDLTDEIFQSVGLAEHVSLETLHSYVQLENSIKISYNCFEIHSASISNLTHTNLS